MGRTGYTCIRHVFCTLNVLIWLCACGVLGAGLWLRFAYSGYTTLVPQYSFASADSILLGVGGLSFLLAFCGCCGAWFQSRFLLISYFTLMILLLLTEFAVGAFAFIFREQLGKSLKAELLSGIRDHYVSSREPGTLPVIWDHIQTEFHCCGVDKYYDWYNINAWPSEERVPDSCCLERQRYCGRLDADHRNQDLWYQEGCASAVHDWMMRRLHLVGWAGLLFGAIELFGLVASMILFCTLIERAGAEGHDVRLCRFWIRPNPF